MGGSVSVLANGRIDTILQNGSLVLAQFPTEALSELTPLDLQLSKLKLGDITPSYQLQLVYSNVLPFSKGDDVPDSLRIVDVHSNDELLAAILKEGNDEDSDIAFCILAECSDLTDISEFSTLLCSLPTNRSNKLKGINFANNHLTNEHLGSLTFLSSMDLVYLHLGGNKLTGALNFAGRLESNSSLMILDLSYTENLYIPYGSFINLPQLRRLVLDTCDLNSTVCKMEDNNEEISLFWGLVQLNELSLQDNNFDGIISLSGLQIFNLSLKYPNNSFVLDVFTPTLKHLWLNDNPYSTISSTLHDVDTYLYEILPFLSTMNDKASPTSHPSSTMVASTTSTNISLAKVLKREGEGGSLSVGGFHGSGLDNMEIEFIAALKNERDVSIAS